MKHPAFLERYFSSYSQTAVRGLIFCVLSLLFASLVIQVKQAKAANGINNQINYQAKLLDDSGVGVADGTYAIKFSIYDAATGGNRLWAASGTVATPIALNVTVQNGLFTILLGDNSTGTTQQNALDDLVNWNSDSLYLGVTIGSDSEMAPRKRLSAAPYAFNAQKLQGMYASSSVFGASTLFTINQTSNTGATGTRTTLLVKSSGTSTVNDFLVRGVNDLDATVFSVNRLGSVTTTGNFALGDAAGDLISVNGVVNSAILPATDLTYSLGSSSLRWNASLANVTSSAVTSTYAYFSSTASTTQLFANGATLGGLVVSGTTVCLSTGTGCASAGSDTLATVTDRGASATATLQLYGGYLASSSTVTSTFTVVGDTSLQNLTFTNGTGSGVTSTALFSTSFRATSGTVTTFAAATLFGGDTTLGGLIVSGTTVCLSNGTGCTGNDTLATVTDRGASATATLQLYGGYLSSSSTVTSTFTVLGGTSLQHATFTSVTGTNFSLTGRVNSNLLPQTDLAYSLGSTSLRWNGVFGSVTTTNVTTTNFYYSGTLSGAFVSGTTLSIVSTVTIPGNENPTKIFVSDRHAFVANQAPDEAVNSFRVWDVTDPSVPTSSVTTTATGIDDLVIDGRYLYNINSGTSLGIYDISSPDRPYLVGSLADSIPSRIQLSGGYAFIKTRIYDVHDPRTPIEVSQLSGILGSIVDTDLVGKLYYTLESSGSPEIKVYDVSDPVRPVLIGSAPFPGFSPSKLIVQGGYAYMVDGSVIRVFDIGDLSNIYQVTSISGFSNITQMQVAGRYLYLLDGNTFKVVDISNPLLPGVVAFNDNGFTDFQVSGRYAYLVTSGITDYFHVIDLGGIDVIALSAGAAELGTLQVRTDGRIAQSLVVGSSLSVGAGGIQVDGPFKVNASNTTSSVAGSIAFEQNAVVGTSTYAGQLNSLFVMDGNDLFTLGNIGSASSVYTNGAFVAGSGSTYYGNGYVYKNDGVLSINAIAGVTFPGSVTSTTQFYGNMVTSTSLFSNGATLGGLVVSGTTVCLTSGTGCAATAGNDTLATVTDRGSSATATLRLYGGFLASSSTVTSTFTVVGLTSLQGATFTSATGTSFSLSGRVNSNLLPQTDLAYSVGNVSLRWNAYLGDVTSTNATTTAFSFTSAKGTTSTITTLAAGTFFANAGTFSSLVASGTTVCLSDGTGCQGGGNDTLGNVTDRGSYATATLQFYGGFIASSSTVTSTFTVLGDTSLQNATAVNLAVTNLLDVFHASSTFFEAKPASSTVVGYLDLSAAADLSVSGKYAYIAEDGFATIQIVDISDPAYPSSTVTLSGGGGSTGAISVVGRYLYLANTDNLRIYDITSPTTPALVSETTATGYALDIQVSGHYAYLSGSSGFAIVDVTDPVSPNVVSTYATTTPDRLYVEGDTLYLGKQEGLQIYDITNRRSPAYVSHYTASASVTGLHVSGRYAYVVANGTLEIVDVSTPSNPLQKSTLAITNANTVALAGKYAYVTSISGLSVVDVSSSTNPVVVSEIPTGGANFTDLQVVGRYIYAVNNADFYIIDTFGADFPTANIGSLFTESIGVGSNVDIGNDLNVNGGLSVGNGGILSLGSLGVSATNSTSSFAGALTVGTTTLGVAMHSLFVMNGDDLFVGGNIGSASSVYTNGAFVAGTGTTMFGSSFISNNSATLTISSVTSVRFDSSIDQTISTSTGVNVLSQYSLTGNAVDVVVSGKFAYVLAPTNLYAVNIEDPQNVSSVNVYTGVLTDAVNLSAQGDRLIYDTPTYGASYVVDVSQPGVIGSVTEHNSGNVPIVSRLMGGDYLWMKWTVTGFTIALKSLSNSAFVFLSSINIDNGARPSALDVQGQYAYAVDVSAAKTSSTLYIFDVSTPGQITLATSTLISDTTSGTHIAVSGRYAYVMESDGSLDVFDVASSTVVRVMATVTTDFATVRDMKIRGKYLYIGGIEGGTQRIKIYDITNPLAPVLVKRFDQLNTQFDINGRYLYVVEDTNDTLQIIDLGGIEVRSFVAPSAIIGDLQVGRDGQIDRSLSIGDSLSVRGSIRAGGRLTADDGIYMNSSGSSPLVTLTNTNSNVGNGTNWAAYISSLTVGSNSAATGTQHYSMVITHASASRMGLCIDDTSTASTCPSRVGYSLVADGPIGASGFDLAERYASTGTVESADLVSLASSASATVMRSPGVPYDPKLIGIISHSPGFSLGIYDGEQVALTGRVPTKVSTINGPIRIGDPLTSSIYPGVAMKATKPGMIVGYALDDADTTSTIEVFVDVGYNANGTLATDGTISTVGDDLTFVATSTASSSNPTVDSFGLTFRGSAWNATTSALTAPSFTLLTDVMSAATSVFALRNASGTNTMTVSQSGDLSIAGRLFLSARGTPQDQFYLYLDDSLAPTSSYIATNANGFQANSSYDLAERYYSPDALEPGDLVMIKPEGRIHVQRTNATDHVVIGIVSTQPGFVLGAHTTSSYPIALAGRVPTKVSAMNGAINAGDPLGPSSIPGVAVKATAGGPIVGYALEGYEGSDVGKVEVFLSAQAALAQSQPSNSSDPSVSAATVSTASPGGFATIHSGATRVHISFDSIGAYPKVFVTPATETEGWWTENYSDTGFDIVLTAPLARDVLFGWEVRPLTAGSKLFSSDNTYQPLDPLSGQVILEETTNQGEEEQTPVAEEPLPDPTTTTEDIVAATSTEPTI